MYVELCSFIALGESNTDDPTGLYRCEIPDASGVNGTLFAGIYRAGEGIDFLIVITAVRIANMLIFLL